MERTLGKLTYQCSAPELHLAQHVIRDCTNPQADQPVVERRERVHMFGISLENFMEYIIPEMDGTYIPLYDSSIGHTLTYVEITKCITHWKEAEGGLKYFRTFPNDFKKEDILYDKLCEGFLEWHDLHSCAGMDINLKVLQEGMY